MVNTLKALRLTCVRSHTSREIKNATINEFSTSLKSSKRLTVKIFQFSRLSPKFLAVLRLSVNPIETLYLGIRHVSIYTLSDLGDLINLIGSPSRTIQQHSPPNEWIMCELGVFPIFLENDLLFKSRQNPRADIFKARKDLEGFNTAFFNLL